MSDESLFNSSSTSQTFLAAAFIVAILALALSIFSISRTTSAVSALLDLQAAAVSANAGDYANASDIEAVSQDLATLTARVRTLEEAAAAAAADQ